MIAPSIDDADDAPRFSASLLAGINEMPPDELDRYIRFFVALTRARELPLHPAVAWNALYWQWDAEIGSYDAARLATDLFPEVTLGEESSAVPIGAFAKVRSGGGTVWGEVVYKEGCRAEVAPGGEVEPRFSGAPADVAEDGRSFRRERLVIDFAAAGSDGDVAKRITRWASRQRWLTATGHVEHSAIYDPAGDASLTNLHFYACWLWSHHFDALQAGWLNLILGGRATRPELWDALLATLGTVKSILEAAPGLRRWSEYWFDSSGYEDRLAAQDHPLGGADLEMLFRSLQVVPSDSRVAYTALRPRLAEFAGTEDALSWTRYPLTVCHTNLRLSELAATEQEPSHLRVDDVWQSAGVWRVERSDAELRCPLIAVPPYVPLGLGFTGEAADQHAPADEPKRHPTVEDLDVTDSFVEWSITLGQRNLEHQRLPVPPVVSAALGSAPVTVRIQHAGDITDEEAHQPECHVASDGMYLHPVRWPFDFFPGIRLWAGMQRGGDVLRLHSLPLEEPVLAGDAVRRFEFDAGTIQPLGAPHDVGRRPITMRRVLLQAIREHGRYAGDRRRASVDDLTAILFDPEIQGNMRPLIRSALDAAVADGDAEHEGDDYLVRAWLRPIGLPDASSALALSSLAAMRRQHTVTLHLRRLPKSSRAEAARQREYHDTVVRLRLTGVLPPHLPHGYTFVREHLRGVYA